MSKLGRLFRSRPHDRPAPRMARCLSLPPPDPAARAYAYARSASSSELYMPTKSISPPRRRRNTTKDFLLSRTTPSCCPPVLIAFHTGLLPAIDAASVVEADTEAAPAAAAPAVAAAVAAALDPGAGDEALEEEEADIPLLGDAFREPLGAASLLLVAGDGERLDAAGRTPIADDDDDDADGDAGGCKDADIDGDRGTLARGGRETRGGCFLRLPGACD